MAGIALIGGVQTFRWPLLLLFLAMTGLVLLFGHSLGSHRKLIHDSFQCPRWLEYALVYAGVQVALAGPIGLLRQHELRDYAQRQGHYHAYLRHGSSFWADGWWQLHCELTLYHEPHIVIETRIARDRFYRFLERTWMLQQLPLALVLYLCCGWGGVVWGVCARITACVTGHWLIGYFAHNHGGMHYRIDGAAVQGHNIALTSLLTMGGCWHNNHHAFPGSARLLWQAQSYNAWGKIEQQSYGNNVSMVAAYEEPTGRVHRITAGLAGATDMVDHTYFWNGLNQLVGRDDADGDGSTGAVTDGFNYDEVGRLHTYTVSAAAIPGQGRNTVIEYNALGSVLSNSDVGIYTYPVPGTGHPHALQSVAGAFTSTYGYDANGNMNSASAGSYRSISYNSFNMPDSQTGLQGPTGTQYTWQYDENHQRIKEMRSNSTGSRTTWMLHPDNAGGLTFESEQGGATISNRHYLSAGGASIGVLISNDALPVLASGQTAPSVLNNVTLDKVEYWHKDHLGSLVATTDQNAAVTARYSYDPFGKRRTVSGNYDASGALVYDWNNTSSGTDRGYTGHEHLDDVGVIHMNGRIFDPRLGMFMQGDPFVQDPTNLQNMNRYGYCYNNPTTCTDPSGQLSLFGHKILPGLFNNKILKAAEIIVASFYGGEYALEFYSDNVAAVVGYSAASASAVDASYMADFYTYDYAAYDAAYAGASSSVTGNAIAGAGSGFAGGLVGSDGNLNSTLRSSVNGFISGGVSGYYGSNYPVERIIANSVAGGIGSILRGSKFSTGFKDGFYLSSLSYLNSQLRENMKNQSLIDPRNDGTGFSKGMFGDGFKLAGGRYYIDRELGTCSLLGCDQNGPGTVFGFPYKAGDISDMITESFAGPHDTANSITWYVHTEEEVSKGLGMIGDGYPANYYKNYSTFLEYATNYSTSLLFALPLALGPIIEQSHALPGLKAK